MKKKEIEIGGIYTAKVTNRLVHVRIDAESRFGGWDATNLTTRKKIRIKSAQRLRVGVAPAGDDGHEDSQDEENAADAPTSTPTGNDTATTAPCPHCGATERDEDGDCTHCLEPIAAPPRIASQWLPPAMGDHIAGALAGVRVIAEAAEAAATAAEESPPPAKTMSGLDAAARVLAEVGSPMTAREMIAAAESKGYWKSPGGKTPHATLYSAIIREIAAKADGARFRKTAKGRFARTT